MNPENLSAEALAIFNHLSATGQREAAKLAETHSEEEAVYLAALREMPESERRRFLFSLSRRRWGL